MTFVEAAESAEGKGLFLLDCYINWVCVGALRTLEFLENGDAKCGDRAVV